MNNNSDEQQPKLTDEEVWLHCYTTVISNPSLTGYPWYEYADECLNQFKKRFRKDERT